MVEIVTTIMNGRGGYMNITDYQYVFANLWNLLKTDIQIAPTITDAYVPPWVAMCDRYQSIVDQAPAEVRAMADSMMRVQVFEIEKMWRFIDEQKLDDKTRPMLASSV